MRFRRSRWIVVGFIVMLPGATAGRAFAQVSRAAAPFLDRPARLHVRDVSLLDALRELERRAGVALAYSPSLLPASLRVSCLCDTVTVRDALQTLLSNLAFGFRETDGQVMLFPTTYAQRGIAASRDTVTRSPAAANVQGPTTLSRDVRPTGLDSLVTITGRVTTDAGTPVPSALVSLPGARVSATTSDAGNYRLVVPVSRLTARAETLHVMRLGFRPASAALALGPGHATVDVTMATQVVALDQVLITGTAGNQARGAQAAVVASIDAPTLLASAPHRDVNQLLYAQTAGVSMTTASGTSGANTRIDIRGQASVSLSNYPLVFVDGVRVVSGPRAVAQAPGGATSGAGGQQFSALNDLNPDDIERIEIVKGPAAATLYGADASAGVIQILTKKGRSGLHRFTEKISTNLESIDPAFTPYANYGKCTAALVGPTSLNPLCRGRAIGAVVSDNVLSRNRAFRTGAAGAVTYSAQGGGDGYGYYGSFSGSNERGTTLGSSLNHRTARASANLIASARLTLDASVGIARVVDKLPQGDQSAYGYLLGGDLGSPLTVTATPSGGITGGWFNNNLNVHAIGSIVTEDNTLRSTPTVQLRYSPRSWLSNRLTIGGDFARTTLFQMFPKNDSGWYSSIANTGSVAVTESNATVYTVDYLGNINHRAGRNGWISSDLSFGSQWVNTLNTTVSGSGEGLLTNASDLLSGATTTTATQGFTQTKSLGIVGQEQLGFNDRLFVQMGARLDRNSAFGSKVGSFFLPKVGVSYVLSQEPFWQPLSAAIPTLRFRAAYGTTGRSPSGAAALVTYTKTNYVTDLGAVLPGVSPGSPGNPDLEPERGTEVEAGIDLGLLHDRAGIEFTYFDKRSKGVLFPLPIAPSSGFSSNPLVNIGEVMNRGWELSIRAAAIDSRNAALDASLTMNALTNRIISLGNLRPFVSANNQCFKPGIEIAAWCVPRVSSVDTIAHRTVVSDTAELAGGQLPKLAAGFASTLTLFRTLRIYAQLDGKFRYSLYNLTRDFRDRAVLPPNSGEVNLPADSGGYSMYERQRRLGPFFTASGTPVGAALVRGPYIVPGDYVRLRELAVTWSLPSRLSDWLRLESSALSLGGRNLALWTKYDGWDPEVIGVIDPATPFLGDVFTTPQTRRFFVRLSLQY